MSHAIVTDQYEAFELIYARLHHLPPLGYRIEGPNWKFLVDETAAPVVRRIWEEALAEKPIRVIAETIEREYQFRTPVRGRTGGRPLHRSTVNNILKDPFYAGYIRLGEKLCKGLHEAIVSEDVFLDVQESLARKRRNWGATDLPTRSRSC